MQDLATVSTTKEGWSWWHFGPYALAWNPPKTSQPHFNFNSNRDILVAVLSIFLGFVLPRCENVICEQMQIGQFVAGYLYCQAVLNLANTKVADLASGSRIWTDLQLEIGKQSKGVFSSCCRVSKSSLRPRYRYQEASRKNPPIFIGMPNREKLSHRSFFLVLSVLLNQRSCNFSFSPFFCGSSIAIFTERIITFMLLRCRRICSQCICSQTYRC